MVLQGTPGIGKAQLWGDSILLVSVASTDLMFELPQKKPCYFFQPQTLFGSKFDFSLLSGSSTWNHEDSTSDSSDHIYLSLFSHLCAFLPIFALILELNLCTKSLDWKLLQHG